VALKTINQTYKEISHVYVLSMCIPFVLFTNIITFIIQGGIIWFFVL